MQHKNAEQRVDISGGISDHWHIPTSRHCRASWCDLFRSSRKRSAKNTKKRTHSPAYLFCLVARIRWSFEDQGHLDLGHPWTSLLDNPKARNLQERTKDSVSDKIPTGKDRYLLADNKHGTGVEEKETRRELESRLTCKVLLHNLATPVGSPRVARKTLYSRLIFLLVIGYNRRYHKNNILGFLTGSHFSF